MKTWTAIMTGFLCGTVGVHMLSSREAKTVYSHVTAAVLHGRDDIVKQAEIVGENCADIYARAVEINERAQAYEENCMIKSAALTAQKESAMSETGEESEASDDRKDTE